MNKNKNTLTQNGKTIKKTFVIRVMLHVYLQITMLLLVSNEFTLDFYQ